MAQFYKELKELRESRGISVEEISERTKINIRYLQAIETGDFDLIEIPYYRLFLRAYAEEIGGDSERALEQLDSFMGTSTPPFQAIPNQIESHSEDPVIHRPDHDIISNSNQKLRQDLMKGGVLLVVFIFAILIFKKIFNEESSAVVTKSGPVIQNKVQSISDQDLLSNFILDQTSEVLLSVTPPFFVKLRTHEQTAYSFKNDTLPAVSNILQANWEHDLGAFINSSELLFTNTKGLTIFINGVNLNHISNYDHPLRLTIKPNPPSMAVHRYIPIR